MATTGEILEKDDENPSQDGGAQLADKEASPVPRSNLGQKLIFWAFYRRSSNFAPLVQPLRARARAGDRPGHNLE